MRRSPGTCSSQLAAIVISGTLALAWEAVAPRYTVEGWTWPAGLSRGHACEEERRQRQTRQRPTCRTRPRARTRRNEAGRDEPASRSCDVPLLSLGHFPDNPADDDNVAVHKFCLAYRRQGKEQGGVAESAGERRTREVRCDGDKVELGLVVVLVLVVLTHPSCWLVLPASCFSRAPCAPPHTRARD